MGSEGAGVQPSLGLSEDVDGAFPLRGHRRPVLGQSHHGAGIQQPVAVRMAHCGARGTGSAGGAQSSPPGPSIQPREHGALTFAAHTIGGPVVGVEVGWL